MLPQDQAAFSPFEDVVPRETGLVTDSVRMGPPANLAPKADEGFSTTTLLLLAGLAVVFWYLNREG